MCVKGKEDNDSKFYLKKMYLYQEMSIGYNRREQICS